MTSANASSRGRSKCSPRGQVLRSQRGENALTNHARLRGRRLAGLSCWFRRPGLGGQRVGRQAGFRVCSPGLSLKHRRPDRPTARCLQRRGCHGVHSLTLFEEAQLFGLDSWLKPRANADFTNPSVCQETSASVCPARTWRRYSAF